MGKILYFDKNVIHQSKVNGAPYVEPEHVNQKWDWPKNTWLRKRLAELTGGSPSEPVKNKECRCYRCTGKTPRR